MASFFMPFFGGGPLDDKEKKLTIVPLRARLDAYLSQFEVYVPSAPVGKPMYFLATTELIDKVIGFWFNVSMFIGRMV